MNELRPCPFCGKRARLDFSRDGGKQYFDEGGYVQYTDFIYLVSCEFCLAKTGNYARSADAIAAWNRRANAESWCFAGKCRNVIEDAPTIEERKRGKWIQDNIASNIFKCSECGCDAPVDPTAGCEIKSNFCYCCGAEMSNSEGRNKTNL